jgi:uncharacterized membrane protein (UPF0136 family)
MKMNLTTSIAVIVLGLFCIIGGGILLRQSEQNGFRYAIVGGVILVGGGVIRIVRNRRD